MKSVPKNEPIDLEVFRARDPNIGIQLNLIYLFLTKLCATRLIAFLEK